VTVQRPTPQDTRAAVEQGVLHAALEGEAGTEAPPNVVVEPANGPEPDAGGRGQAWQI
jgi:hypothetical protein